MWLITTLLAAVTATALSLRSEPRYQLKILSLMLWGASVMIFVDHVLGFDGGDFIHITTEGMITNSTLLGIAMLIPILIIWTIYVIVMDKRTGDR